MLNKLSEFYSNLSRKDYNNIERGRKVQGEEYWRNYKTSLREELDSAIEGFGLFWSDNDEKRIRRD